MKHFIITRAAYPPEYPLEKNRQRLKLFRSICVPALAQQRCRDFEWVIRLHPKDKLIEQRKAAALLAYVPVHFVTGTQQRWREDVPSPSLQTRMDDDDALAVGFTARLRAAAESNNREWYTFPNGITASGRRCRRMYSVPNQFVTRRCGPGQTVFDVKHGAVRSLNPLHVDEEIAWMWWRHKNSRSPSRTGGMKVPLRDYLHTFGCDWMAMGFLKNLPDADWSLSDEAGSALQGILRPGMTTLEFGSGKSTDIFEQARCWHTSIEHDQRFCTHPSSVLCPIVGGWYNWSPQRTYDVVLVDGPPERFGRDKMAEKVIECVGPGSVVLVDDLQRDQERQQFAMLSERAERSAVHPAAGDGGKVFGLLWF